MQGTVMDGFDAGTERRPGTVLVIYDLDGGLQAVSGAFSREPSGWEDLLGSELPPDSCFASGDEPEANPVSTLPLWVAGEIREARQNGPRFSQISIEHEGKRLKARFQTLTSSAGPFGYALHLDQCSEAGGAGIADGSAVITRQQWHDIKNRLGGLKLYATFLRKKTCNGEDHEVVEKLLNGINGLIDYLARIRRGETK